MKDFLSTRLDVINAVFLHTHSQPNIVIHTLNDGTFDHDRRHPETVSRRFGVAERIGC